MDYPCEAMVTLEFYSDTNRALAEDRLRGLGLNPETSPEGLLISREELDALPGDIADVVHEFGGNISD